MGADTAQLTRPKAQELISNAPGFSPTEMSLPLRGAFFDLGVKQGWWVPGIVGVDLTARGKEIFKLTATLASGPKLRFVKPIRRFIIAVTGITDAPQAFGPNAKVVQYTGGFDVSDFPKEVAKAFDDKNGNPPGTFIARFAEAQKKNPGQSEALLKLYDDGWRVEKVEMGPGF